MEKTDQGKFKTNHFSSVFFEVRVYMSISFHVPPQILGQH